MLKHLNFYLFLFLFAITIIQLSEAANKIMLSSTGLNPPGIYFSSADIKSGLNYAYNLFYNKNVIDYSYPVISPDGQLFARFEQTFTERKLVIRKVEDGSLVVETRLDGYNPQWMPGGLIFFETRVGSKSICSTISINDTNDIKKIAELSNQYYPPSDPGLGAAALSDDARKLAFIRSDTTVPGLLTPYLYDLASQKEEPLYPPGHSGKLDDTSYRKIIFASGPPAPRTIRHLSWSPDRKRICVYGTVTFEKQIPGDTTYYWESKTGIFVISTQTYDIKTIYETKNFAWDHPDNFFFSTDGSKIAFNANIDGPTHTLIAIADRTKEYKDIGKGTIICGQTSKQYWVLNPWSPDGSRVLYESDNILKTGFYCEEGYAINDDVGQLYLQDAQWADFSNKSAQAPEITLINPAPDLLNDNGFVQNPGLLAYYYNPAEGIAADGAGRLLIRIKIKSKEPADIMATLDTAFCAKGVTGKSNEDGSLSIVEENKPDPNRKTVYLKSNTKINNIAYFIYNAPVDFVRQGTDDSGRGDRTIQISIIVEGKLYYANVKIKRPPVFLLHGLWSSQDVWDDFFPLGTPWKQSADARFTVYRGDYMPYNNRQVDTITARYNSKGELKAGILKELNDAITDYSKNNRIVAVQADVIAHSLGGLITRTMSDPLTGTKYYFKKENYFMGMVHKLITLDSPHKGSEYCDALWDEYIDEDETGKKFMDWLLYSNLNNGSPLYPKSPIGGGAIGNMTTDADRLYWLNHPENVKLEPPLHTFCGIASTKQIEENNLKIGLGLWMLLDVRWEFEPFKFIFGNQEHDMVVSLNSQRAAGIFDNEATRITIFDSTVHSTGFDTKRIINTAVVGSPEKVIELLNAERNSNLFSTNGRFEENIKNDDDEIVTRNGISSNNPVTHTNISSSNAVGSENKNFIDGLNILKPTPNEIINSGDEIEIDVANESSVNITRVLLVAFNQSLIDSIPPFKFNITVPNNFALGTTSLSAFGIDTSGIIYRDSTGTALADSINVIITTNASLDSIVAGYKKEIILNDIENEVPLYVKGFYFDNSVKDISRDTKTNYLKGDNNVIKIENTVIKALNPGNTFIAVENSGKTDTLYVSVESSNSPPEAKILADSISEPLTNIQLDGSSSFDSDGSIITYRWQLVFSPEGSDAVILDSTGASAFFIADKEGYYVAKLTVIDNDNASSYAMASILVEDVNDVETPDITLTGEQGYYININYDFNTLNISIIIKKDSYIRADLIGIMGYSIYNIMDSYQHSSTNNYSFNIGNLNSGAYFVRVQINESVEIKPIILLR